MARLPPYLRVRRTRRTATHLVVNYAVRWWGVPLLLWAHLQHSESSLIVGRWRIVLTRPGRISPAGYLLWIWLVLKTWFPDNEDNDT